MHTSKNVSLAEPQKLALSLLILHTQTGKGNIQSQFHAQIKEAREL